MCLFRSTHYSPLLKSSSELIGFSLCYWWWLGALSPLNDIRLYRGIQMFWQWVANRSSTHIVILIERDFDSLRKLEIPRDHDEDCVWRGIDWNENDNDDVMITSALTKGAGSLSLIKPSSFIPIFCFPFCLNRYTIYLPLYSQAIAASFAILSCRDSVVFFS